MTPRALVLLSISLSAPACTLLVKSDDLVGGPSAPAGEAGGSDGASDVLDTADGGQRCQGKTLCDDFEGSGTIPWRPTQSGNAIIVVDAVNPRGGTRALHASRAAAPGREAAYYGYDLAGALRFCELDVLATSTTGEPYSVFNFGFSSVEAPFTSYSLSMQMGGSLAQFGGKGGAPALYTDVHVASLKLGRWTHVRIDLDWTPSSPAVILTVDGATEPRFPITPPKGAAPFVQLGMTYQAAQDAGWEVFIDNVICATD